MYLDTFSPERRPSVKTRVALQVGPEYKKQKLSISVVNNCYISLHIILGEHFSTSICFEFGCLPQARTN